MQHKTDGFTFLLQGLIPFSWGKIRRIFVEKIGSVALWEDPGSVCA